MQQQGVEGVDDDREEERGGRVALPKAVRMVDQRAWVPVDENARGGSGDKDANPFTPPSPEPKMLEDLKEEGP